MARIAALAPVRPPRLDAIDGLRALIVWACALALILAGEALPGIAVG